MSKVVDDDMNSPFRDLTSGEFATGLAKLNEDPEWHDDRADLDGPFRLGFPRAQGWGEELLVASLLKRHAGTSKAGVTVFASPHVCSILKVDPVFHTQLRSDNAVGRPPLAILRHALIGDLLETPFVPLSPSEATPPLPSNRRLRMGIAWASVSNNRPIAEKSVPVERFLPILTSTDADFISLQRKLHVADPNGLLQEHGVPVLADEVLDATDEDCLHELVEAIRGLDCIVTISTTTTHMAAAMGIRVELIAAEREGQQWFWQVQVRHGKCFYPTVKVHLGNGRKEDWWAKSLESLRASLSSQEVTGGGVP